MINHETLPKASRSSKTLSGLPSLAKRERARAPLETGLRFGLGLDIVEVSRVKAVARRSKRFLTRVFTPDEIAYCQAKKNPWPHFAVRFAAKEAVWKALGQKKLSLKDISVARDQEGRPSALLYGKKTNRLELSLTHSRDYALAVAIKK